MQLLRARGLGAGFSLRARGVGRVARGAGERQTRICLSGRQFLACCAESAGAPARVVSNASGYSPDAWHAGRGR
eukprot:7688102-Lingulodinium_polyedra.AAC.1